MNVLNLLKKSNLIIVLLLSTFTLFTAQSKRFYYELNFKRDTLGTNAKEIMVLEINKNTNIFLSNNYIVTDSLNEINKNNVIFAYPKFKQVVEYIKSDGSFNFINNLSMHYYEFNAKKKINWKILNEKKTIGSFNAVKATAEYGGRIWTAWFSPDIQFPYGPYVFYGLPGLILQVFDDANNYNFSFIQNKNYNSELNSENFIKKLFGDRKFNIQEKDWKKIQFNYYNNPIPEYKNGEAIMMEESGENYTSIDYRNLEKKIQNQIKIFNNPIELSEKINYK